MLFQPDHIEAIRSGAKTATRRDWADSYSPPREGSVQMATTEIFTPDDECDCYIIVTEVYRQRLGDMDADDAEGGYSLSDFRET